MGYTHYWRDVRRDEARWALLTQAAQKIFAVAADRVPLAGGSGTGAPAVRPAAIIFNGRDPDSYETFDFVPGESFGFCKTGQRPYDVVVCAILACASHLNLALVTSDGDPPDWEPGVALAAEALGADPTWSGLAVPFGVRDPDEAHRVVQLGQAGEGGAR